MQLFNGDCLEILPTLPGGSVDLIICDLPYGVLNKSNEKARWDEIIPLDTLWEQYRRILKEHGTVVLFGQGMFSARLMMSAPDLWRYNLVWDKDRTTGFLDANRRPLKRHEDIIVFQRPGATYNPQMQVLQRPKAANSHSKKNSCYGSFKENYSDTADRYEKYPDSIIRAQREPTTEIVHPTQKPVNLLRYLILTYSNRGDTVLDNCIGSGTTGVACMKEGREFIGIEKEPEYFEIAKKRIETIMSEPNLFTINN